MQKYLEFNIVLCLFACAMKKIVGVSVQYDLVAHVLLVVHVLELACILHAPEKMHTLKSL